MTESMEQSVQTAATMTCSICSVDKQDSEFPKDALTETCDHPQTTCFACMKAHTRVAVDNGTWKTLGCPQCGASLTAAQVEKVSDAEVFQKYAKLSFDDEVSSVPGFVWCQHGCGSGQVHEGGEAQPILTCHNCRQRSCVHHGTRWHEGISCRRYDALGRQSNGEGEGDEEEEDEETMDPAEREEIERVVREIDEREENEHRGCQQLSQLASEAQEEQESLRLIQNIGAKNCPECGILIQKIAGCDHMTCKSCFYEFCFECRADYRQILDNDNSLHDPNCKFHTNNL